MDAPMTEHPLLAAIPPDRRSDLLDTVPVGPGLITVTAIPADQWGEREVIAWRPDGDTALVVVETALMNPDDVPHRVAEFTATLRQALDRITPDQPTPVELTEQQMDALIDAGNRALNDHYHESQCHCDDWPASCVSSGHYFMGAWDTDAFAIGLPAALGVWESLRNDRHAAEIAELRSRIAELEGALPSRFSAIPAQIDTFLRATLAEDTYLGFQQAIGAHALEEAVEDAGTVRASADNDGLYNADWREGWDDAIERVDPDRNGPTPVQLVEFGEAAS